MGQAKKESATDGWRRQRRERGLGSDKRAGVWAESRAVKMRLDFLRRGWFLVAIWPAIVVAAAAASLLIPDNPRPYLLGGLVATGIWGPVYMVGTMSGASSIAMGALSERWTAGELRRLRRRGWNLVNGVHYRRWDIDHVVLGPGGAIVVETKFSADGWGPSKYTSGVMADAVARVRGNATDVQLSLGKSTLPDNLVHPVVVLWGRSDRLEIFEQHDGVHVLSGHLLRSWLSGVEDSGLEPATANGLFRKLVDQVERRDRQDLERSGPLPKPISSRLSLVLLAAVLGLVGFFAELEAVVHLAGWLWVAPIGAAFYTVQIPFRRWQGARPWRTVWVAGSQFVTAALAIAYLAQALAHL